MKLSKLVIGQKKGGHQKRTAKGRRALRRVPLRTKETDGHQNHNH